MLLPYYNIKLDVSDYQLIVINDFIRFFVIQLFPQLMFFITRSNYELFSSIFIETTIYIMLSILIYWFVVNNIVVFTNNKNHEKDSNLDEYYQNNYS